MEKDVPLIQRNPIIECVMHKDIEPDLAITCVTPLRQSQSKYFVYCTLVFFTAGLFALLSFWFPDMRIRFIYTKCKLEHCSHIYVKSKYYQSLVRPTRKSSALLGEILVFEFQHLPYYFDGNCFQPLTFNTNISSKSLIDTYGKGRMPSEVPELRNLYGPCQILVPIIPLPRMILSEMFNPFYVFQMYSVILWYCDVYYYYASAIIVITTISLISSISTTRKGMIALHELAKKECRVIVNRPGETKEISSADLVPGDLIEISGRMDLPCDLCLISGGCVVEEGMLTGESVPVLKDAIHYMDEHKYDADTDRRHTLYEGTRVIQKRNYSDRAVLAIVVRTGFATVKGRLIRSIMYPKPNKFRFYEDSLKFIAFLAFLTIVGFSICLPRMIYLEYEDSDIALRVLDLVTITVPPALPACMAAGLAFAVSRLQASRIFCISPQRINVAGRIDLFVFDKTGTLTEDGMNLLGVQSHSNLQLQDLKQSASETNDPFAECMASCHSLTLIDKEIAGDTQDLQIFKSTGWIYEEPDSEIYDPIVKAVVKPPGTVSQKDPFDKEGHVSVMIDIANELGILHIFHFTSKLKRMGVITKNLRDEKIMFYCKGAPEVILERCVNVPKDIDKVLARYTIEGYRVLACGGKQLMDFKYSQIKSMKLEDIETRIELLGLIILQNKLKKETTPALKSLKDAKIRTIMATGDAALTGISVARECGMISSTIPVFLGEMENNEVIWQEFDVEEASKIIKLARPPWIDHHFSDHYVLAITGTAFAHMLKEAETDQTSMKALSLCLEKCQVYARMAPEHKTMLVEKLQERKYLVGMCGDGANDCGALTAADVGISLSESDSSIAAPFTSQNPDISSVIVVLREGRCTLTASIQCFKFMALCSFIQFTSVSFLYWYLGNLTDNQYLIFDLFTVMPLAMLMSKTAPCETLSPQMPTSELISLRILTSVTLQAITQGLFQLGTYMVALYTFHSAPDIKPGEEAHLITYEDTIITFISLFQYQIICAAFSIGKPWKKPSYTNLPFTSYQVALFIVSVCFLMFHNEVVEAILNVKELEFSFKVYLIGIVVLYAAVVYMIEKNIVPWIDRRHKNKVAAEDYERVMKDLQFG